MDTRIFLILSCLIFATSAWSRPYYPVPRRPMRFTRFAPPPPPHLQLRPYHHPHVLPHHLPQHQSPVDSADLEDTKRQQRPKRGHDDYDHDHDHYHHDHRGTSGVTGPVHTFVKTDKNANYKWGVRHHVGDKYAS